MYFWCLTAINQVSLTLAWLAEIEDPLQLLSGLPTLEFAMEKVEVRTSQNGSNGGHGEDVEKWSSSEEVRVESTSATNYIVDPEAEKRYVNLACCCILETECDGT